MWCCHVVLPCGAALANGFTRVILEASARCEKDFATHSCRPAWARSQFYSERSISSGDWYVVVPLSRRNAARGTSHTERKTRKRQDSLALVAKTCESINTARLCPQHEGTASYAGAPQSQPQRLRGERNRAQEGHLGRRCEPRRCIAQHCLESAAQQAPYQR